MSVNAGHQLYIICSE